MPLQKPTRGLSDLLGLFEGGNVTQEYSGIVTPGLDILRFMAPPEWISKADSFNWAAGTFRGDKIPEDEQWVLWNIGGSTALPQGAGITMLPVPMFQDVTGANIAIGTDRNPTGSTAGTYPYFGQQYSNGLWLQPGGTLGVFITARSAPVVEVISWGYSISRFRL